MDSSVTIPINISTNLLWGIFAVIFLIYLAMTWVLHHHWNYYGIKDNNKIFVKSVYYIVSISILVLIVLLISAYELTETI